MKHSDPNITAVEREALLRAFDAGHLADGEVNREFEQAFKDMFGYKHVVTLNSGTSAMHLALLAMNIGPGDEVLTTPYSMIATVNVILAVGATPVFVDIDRHTYNMDPKDISSKLSPRVRACLPASIFGVPCDAKGIREQLPDYVPILEDSIEALGARRDGDWIGKDVDAAAFGFYPNKQITTCEGGVLVSNSETLIYKVSRLSRHGVMTGDLSYQSMGFNMRLSDLHAALGVAQLSRLWEMQHRLSKVAQMLDYRFGHLRCQRARLCDVPTWFIYPIELPSDVVSKEAFIKAMAKEGIPVKPYFNVMHKFAHVKQYASELPVAEYVGSRTVALPFHHGITSEDVERMYEAYLKVINA